MLRQNRLTDHIISVPAFEPMDESVFEAAKALMEKCGSVIDAGTPTGKLNEYNGRLLELARRKGLRFLKQ